MFAGTWFMGNSLSKEMEEDRAGQGRAGQGRAGQRTEPESLLLICLIS